MNELLLFILGICIGIILSCIIIDFWLRKLKKDIIADAERYNQLVLQHQTLQKDYARLGGKVYSTSESKDEVKKCLKCDLIEVELHNRIQQAEEFFEGDYLSGKLEELKWVLNLISTK